MLLSLQPTPSSNVTKGARAMPGIHSVCLQLICAHMQLPSANAKGTQKASHRASQLKRGRGRSILQEVAEVVCTRLLAARTASRQTNTRQCTMHISIGLRKRFNREAVETYSTTKQVQTNRGSIAITINHGVRRCKPN